VDREHLLDERGVRNVGTARGQPSSPDPARRTRSRQRMQLGVPPAICAFGYVFPRAPGIDGVTFETIEESGAGGF